jgi:hypothetical protein
LRSTKEHRLTARRSRLNVPTGINDFSGNMRLGTRRSNDDGGPSLHHGKGWNGKVGI